MASKLYCKECGYSKEYSEKDILVFFKKTAVCPSCSSKLSPLVERSEDKQKNFSLEDIETFKKERLVLLKKKADDIKIESKIKGDELLIKGESVRVEFFKQSMDVFTLSQLIMYDVSETFLKMLNNVPIKLLEAEGSNAIAKMASLPDGTITQDDLVTLILTKI